MARNQCGYCGKLGHNRRSCSQLTSDLKHSYEHTKKLAEEAAQTYGEDSDKHVSALRSLQHYTRRVAERTGKNPHTNMPTEKKRKVSCSYCKNKGEYHRAKGHTRRSCKHLKEATAQRHASNVDYRRHVVKQLNETGVTPGALLLSDEHVRGPKGWEMKQVVFMVTSIISENVSSTHPSEAAIVTVPVGSHTIHGERQKKIALPRLKRDANTYYGVNYKTGKVMPFYDNHAARPIGYPSCSSPIGGWFPTEDKEKIRGWQDLLVLARGSEFSPSEDWYTKESPLVKQWLS